MAPASRPLSLIRAEDASSMFTSVHSFLTDMWGSHRGAAPSILVARNVDTSTELLFSKSPSGRAYIVFWAIVAFQLLLIIRACIGLRIMKEREIREIRKIRQEISEAWQKPKISKAEDYKVIRISDAIDDTIVILTLQETSPAPPPCILKN